MKRLQTLGGGLLAALVLALSGPAGGQQPPTDQPAQPAMLKVLVPAGATLEIDGYRTQQTGEVRRFVSPPLAPGKKYVYALKATFVENGKPVTRERSVTVQAGKEAEVDLRTDKGAVKKKDEEPIKKKDEEPVKKKDEEPIKKKTEEPKEKTIVVPFVPTPQVVVNKMLDLAAVKKGDTVYDLGCGDGRIVITAVQKYGAKKGVGIDLNPERIKDSEANAKKAGVAGKVEFKQGDVLKLKDLSEADVVTLYLLPEVNLRLMPVLKKTLKPGARIVSHDFDMGDWKPEKEVKVTDEDGIDHLIYLWTIPGGKKGETDNEKPKKGTPVKDEGVRENGPAPRQLALADDNTIVVPFVPTPQEVVDKMLDLAAIKKGDVVYDLGCGDGRIVVTAVKKYGAKKGFGLDLNPERIKDSEANAKKAGVAGKVEFKQGDVLKLKDLSEADVVTLYLLPEVNLRLMPVLKKTLKPGARIVSHDFDMGDWKPEKTVRVEANGREHTVYLWTMPAKK